MTNFNLEKAKAGHPVEAQLACGWCPVLSCTWVADCRGFLSLLVEKPHGETGWVSVLLESKHLRLVTKKVKWHYAIMHNDIRPWMTAMIKSESELRRLVQQYLFSSKLIEYREIEIEEKI